MIDAEVLKSAMETRAKVLAGERRLLAGHLAEANAELAELMAKWAEPLKIGAAAVDDSERKLIDYIEHAPQLFVRPQSVEVDGVRFGIRKGKGRLEYADEAKLIARIEKQLTRGQRGPVLKITKRVLKGPLAKLSADILKRLGVNVRAAGPEAFVSYPKSKLQKRVDWWLKPAGADDDGGEEDE